VREQALICETYIFASYPKKDSQDASGVISEKMVRQEICSGEGISAKERYEEFIACTSNKH